MINMNMFVEFISMSWENHMFKIYLSRFFKNKYNVYNFANF